MSEEQIEHDFEDAKNTTAEELLRHALAQMWESDNPEAYITLQTEQVDGSEGPTVVYKLSLYSINGILAVEEEEANGSS